MAMLNNACQIRQDMRRTPATAFRTARLCSCDSMMQIKSVKKMNTEAVITTGWSTSALNTDRT